MVVKNPVPGISKRFQTGTFDQVFQVVEAHGDGADAKAYTLSDLTGNRELPFEQPVALDRLIPVEMLPLAHVDGDTRTRIGIHEGGRERRATIVNQTMDGRVYIRYDDETIDHCVDLASLRYEWL